jgi:ribonuclease HI
LIVYTDGSSLSNGKTNARAGLGVYYGYGGRAVESNISERVPGILQTNNRGELLVSCSPCVTK